MATISNKVENYKKLIKEAHHTMIKGAIHQGNIMDLKMNAPNNRVKKYMKQKLMGLKGEIAKSIMIVGLQNPPLSK